MEVFIAQKHTPYEGTDIIGVFSNSELAESGIVDFIDHEMDINQQDLKTALLLMASEFSIVRFKIDSPESMNTDIVHPDQIKKLFEKYQKNV